MHRPATRLNWRALRGAGLELRGGRRRRAARWKAVRRCVRLSLRCPELRVQLMTAIRPMLGQVVASKAHLNTHSLGRPASDRDTLRK